VIAHRPCRFIWEYYPEFFRGLARLRWRLAREAATGSRDHRVAPVGRLADGERGEALEDGGDRRHQERR
jgi:hypothetical protein